MPHSAHGGRSARASMPVCGRMWVQPRGRKRPEREGAVGSAETGVSPCRCSAASPALAAWHRGRAGRSSRSRRVVHRKRNAGRFWLPNGSVFRTPNTRRRRRAHVACTPHFHYVSAPTRCMHAGRGVESSGCVCVLAGLSTRSHIDLVRQCDL